MGMVQNSNHPQTTQKNYFKGWTAKIKISKSSTHHPIVKIISQHDDCLQHK